MTYTNLFLAVDVVNVFYITPAFQQTTTITQIKSYSLLTLINNCKLFYRPPKFLVVI